MSCSKPLPPFTFDLLCYLNRDQLERFSIICRPLKNLIDRYFNSKPYRIFDGLLICEGSYALYHNFVRWHPNREDYSVQQFLGAQKCSIDIPWTNEDMYYSYAEMRPYLGTNIRMKKVTISVAEVITYNSEHIEEMESIAYLWRDSKVEIVHVDVYSEESRILAEDLKLGSPEVLNSPIILQCHELLMDKARFSFKDYKVLYAVKVIETCYYSEYKIDLWQQYWQQFLEKPDVKPIVVFRSLNRENLDNLLDRLSKAFSSAVSPNSFKIIFAENDEELTEFRATNNASGEILELKEGFPVEYHNEHLNESGNYTLERSNV